MSSAVQAPAESAATSLSPHPHTGDVAATSRDKREQKPCERCGKIFGRAVSKSGIVQGHAAFAAKRFCSRRCGMIGNTRGKGKRR